MKRVVFLSKSFVILAMMLSLVFTSCKKGWWGDEDGPGKGGNNGGGNNAIVKGTIIKFDCGASYYGNNYWIRTDDGKLLQPCDQSFVTFCGIILKEGDRVEFKYSKYIGSIKDYEVFCKSNIVFSRVTIDFINVINTNSSCLPVSISKDFDQLNIAGVNIMNAKIENNKLVLNIGFSGCDNATKRFQLIAKELPNAGPIPAFEVKMTDDNTQMCQAYFTMEICYDLTPLKNPVSSKVVSIHLVGYDKILQF